MYEKLKKHFKRFHNDTAGQLGSLEYLIGLTIGIVVLIALFAIVPIIGENLDSATDVGANSDWNSSNNPDIETGVGLWTDIGPLITLAAIISVLSVVILIIMQLRGPGGP